MWGMSIDTWIFTIVMLIAFFVFFLLLRREIKVLRTELKDAITKPHVELKNDF